MQYLIDKFYALPLWQRLVYVGIVILVAILINPLSKALAGLLFIVAVCGALYGLVFRTGNARAWANVAAGAFILLIIVGFFQPIRVSTTSSPAPAPAPAPAAAPSPAPAPAPAPAAASKKSSDDVAVRVSGTPGIDYSGSYGATQGQRTVDGILAAAPTEYDVEAKTGRFEFDAISAVFQKRSPGAGSLLVEIIHEGEVVASQETSAEFGVASVTWSPQNR